MAEQVILGFDTSGSYCGTALFVGDDVIAAHYVDMVKGQAESLMPMLEETLRDGGVSYQDLTRLAVGTGPGNFTGIRIAVSAARGLALALGIPAVGVTLFEALKLGAPLPFLASLQATRREVYISEITEAGASVPIQVAIEDIQPPSHSGCVCIGHRSAEIAGHLGLDYQPALYAPASAIARVAALATPDPDTRPAPYYLRPADAAPPRDPAPVILD